MGEGEDGEGVTQSHSVLKYCQYFFAKRISVAYSKIVSVAVVDAMEVVIVAVGWAKSSFPLKVFCQSCLLE